MQVLYVSLMAMNYNKFQGKIAACISDGYELQQASTQVLSESDVSELQQASMQVLSVSLMMTMNYNKLQCKSCLYP